MTHRSLIPLVLLFLSLLASGTSSEETSQVKKPNVLFIAVDDLNHWVGHLHRNEQTMTPNIDRLAARGVSMTRAYCAAPACNPSRAALMSGLRPATTGVYRNADDWRPRIAPEKTLPSFFRRNGYYVAGAGKIYHGGFPRVSEWDDYFKRERSAAAKGSNRAAAEPDEKGGAVGALRYRQLAGDDSVMNDYHVVSYCMKQLERGHEKPFFLACGIYRPHLPWNVPRKYFDMHPLENIELPPFKENDLDDLPPAGRRMAAPGKDHARVVKAGKWKELIQAYLASISFADAQVGRLIAALDRSRYMSNTIVVLWGDHGWHLGEKHHWRKFSLWEEATRAPLIWVVPGVTKPGGFCERTVDFMSIYPTLADLCGLEPPEHLQGASIRILLADPSAEWKRSALTTHGRGNHALRNDRWRYIRYADSSEELYDAMKDPYEWNNLAAKSEFAEVKKSLLQKLKAIPGTRGIGGS